MADAMTGVAETPLQDLLRRIPRDAIYRWAAPEADRAAWQLASNSAPIGRLAHEAADRLDKAASPPAREEAPAEGAVAGFDPSLSNEANYERFKAHVERLIATHPAPATADKLRGIIDAATDAALPPVCDVTGNGTKERASIQVEIANRIIAALNEQPQ